MPIELKTPIHHWNDAAASVNVKELFPRHQIKHDAAFLLPNDLPDETVIPVSPSVSLEQIIAKEVESWLKWHHLNRDIVIGLIGTRGDGKSFTGATLSVRDNMIEGETCWSNMEIKCSISVTNNLAARYGRNEGGIVVYQSEKIDKKKLLKLGDEYQGGLIFLDEINMEFAEAMRSTSNTNLYMDRVGQQLRKLKSSLYFTVIHEMWVDSRIRNLTDVFIKCEDTALSKQGLYERRKPGQLFKWVIYTMSRKLTGESYYQTKQTMPPVLIPGKTLWGLIDTNQMQARGNYSYKTDLKDTKTELEIKKSPEVEQHKDKWQWLYDEIQSIHDQGVLSIESRELWHILDIKNRGFTPQQIGLQLNRMGLKKNDDMRHPTYFFNELE